MKLQDVAALIADCEHKTAPAALRGSEFAYSIGTPNIRGGRILLTGAKQVDAQTYEGWTQRATPQRDDLVLAREAPVGDVGRVDGRARVCLGQRTVLIRPNGARVDPRFLHFVLLSFPVQRWMRDRASGSTVEHLNVADVREIELGSLPTLREQGAIAEMLGALDDKIEANEQIAQRSCELASAILEEVLVVAEASGDRTHERLGAIATVNSRRTKPGTGPIQYLDISAVGDGNADKPRAMDWEEAPSRARLLVADGDTIWSTVRPNRRSHCLILDPPENLVVSTGFAVLTPTLVGPSLLYGLTDRPAFEAYLVSIADGSAYPAVLATRYLDAVVTLPPAEVRAAYEAKTMPLRRMAAAADQETLVLVTLRDAILPKLLSGELRVRDAKAPFEDAV